MRPTPRNRRAQLPFVLINMAMTADGKIATANRRVNSFSSPLDQVHLLELRATADAVMAGARTVEVDGINLGPGAARYRRLRLARGLAEYNLRIIVSGSGSVDPHAEVFRHRFSPVIVLTTAQISRARRTRLQAVADAIKVCGRKDIDFAKALRWLRVKWGVCRLLCEGGAELNHALFSADLVDEIHLTVCPRIIGGRFAPSIADGVGAARLRDAKEFRLHSLKRRGDEVFLIYRRAR